MTPRLVVGAIVVDDLDSPTRVLATRRSRPPELAGQWEFPGGKVEPGESPEDALVREVHEELGAQVAIGRELAHPEGVWPISESYALRLFFAVLTNGSFVAGDSHDELRWLAADELDSVEWLPADLAAVAALSRVVAP